ncbi:MAG: 3-oxoacyl-ACP synthase III family protein [Bacteroidales bacterium]
MNKSYIQDIAIYLPETIETNEDLQKEFPDKRMAAMKRLTGIGSRHISGPDLTAGDMCIQAAEKLFSQGKADRNKIDYILFNTNAPDYITPPTSCIIQDKLKIPKGQANTVDITQGCCAYITLLNLAKALIESGSATNVLVLTGENSSWCVHKKDFANRLIFGDAGAATLVSNEKNGGLEIGKFKFGSDGERHDKIIIKYGRARHMFPECIEPDFIDEEGNTRNHTKFHMDSAAIFNFGLEVVPDLIRHLSEINQIGPDEIDYYVPHQANKLVLDSVFKKSNIPLEKRVIEIEDVGNTISASIPVTLKKMIDKEIPIFEKKIMLFAFGTGLIWGGTIIYP